MTPEQQMMMLQDDKTDKTTETMDFATQREYEEWKMSRAR